MATTLPPISRGRGGTPTRPEYAQPRSPKGPPSGKLKPLIITKRGKEAELWERRQTLRAQQPKLNKSDTAGYRNKYKHNLCLDMLQEGYHLSFQELFALIKRQQEDRLRAGPESMMWTQVMLGDQHEKLDKLKKYLTIAETAQRKGDFGMVYNARFELARYFNNPDDKWLSDHFFNTCLSTSTLVEKGGGKLQAEGHLNVGLALTESGNYFEAAKHFEAYLSLADTNRDWMKDDTTSYYTDSCMRLYEIYTTIGNQVEPEDPELALSYFIKAFEMAKASAERKLEGEAAYHLGLAYEKSGEAETALEHLNMYLDTCKITGDEEGIGRACDAVAKAYASQGKTRECISYLQQFVEFAEKSGHEAEYSRACHNLGNIFNILGKYEEAAEYFSKAYNISRAFGESGAVQVNRVQFGIAQAHRMLQGIAGHVVRGDQACLVRLIEWKNSRAAEFNKGLPGSEKSADNLESPSDTDLTPYSDESTEDTTGQTSISQTESSDTVNATTSMSETQEAS